MPFATLVEEGLLHPPSAFLRNVCATLFGIAFLSPGPVSAQASNEHSERLRFVREFSGADDVRHDEHPILDRSLDIIAGPADPRLATRNLLAPQGLVTDSKHRVFVADPEAGVVHVFDFEQSRYSVLRDSESRMRSPVALAVDPDDRLYVADTAVAAVLVFDSRGKFLRYLGKEEGSETFFQSPRGVAVQTRPGRIYVCDSRRNMILVLDKKAHIVAHVGQRFGGLQPGEFRDPSRIALVRGDLFVLDSGNMRLQILDSAGHFRRDVKLAEASLDDGMAVDNEKNIYVSDVYLNVINVFDQYGRFLYKFGRTGTKPGEFNEPSGLWIDEANRLYVADTKNHRVQLFQIERPNPTSRP
jgi:DNA-binding beta-propeller fold protein YncE